MSVLHWARVSVLYQGAGPAAVTLCMMTSLPFNNPGPGHMVPSICPYVPHEVVPAKAGTHTPCPLDRLRRMGPGSAAASRPWPGRHAYVVYLRLTLTYFYVFARMLRAASFTAVMISG